MPFCCFQRAKICTLSRNVNNAATLYNHTKFVLMEKSVPVHLIDMFHRTIDSDSYERIVNTFKSPDSPIRCLFSTVAFGLGIQIPDISLVVHWGVPKTVLSYWQEVGRAGRDGRQSFAICYAYGRSMAKKMTDQSMIDTAKTAGNQKCSREEVLNNTKLSEMDAFSSDSHCCRKKCVACRCSQCMCCTNCYKKCPCSSQTENGIRGLNIPNLV